MRLAALFAAAALAFAVPALAKDAPPTERDPVAQARAVNLANELRCLVCQNQSIAESNAELAVDLRRQIDEQIGAGIRAVPAAGPGKHGAAVGRAARAAPDRRDGRVARAAQPPRAGRRASADR